MLWKVGGFTFDLTSSSVVPGTQNANFVDVKGAGTVSGNGFANTPGQWSFSANNSSGQDKASFSFQSDTTVPEASTVVFLAIGGFGLVGAKLLRRKLKKAA
jgi:hypothetical protein